MLNLQDAFAQVLVTRVQSSVDKVTPRIAEQVIRDGDLEFDIKAEAYVDRQREKLKAAVTNGESQKVQDAIQRQIDKYTQ